MEEHKGEEQPTGLPKPDLEGFGDSQATSSQATSSQATRWQQLGVALDERLQEKRRDEKTSVNRARRERQKPLSKDFLTRRREEGAETGGKSKKQKTSSDTSKKFLFGDDDEEKKE
jgi:hypothetical protein